MRVRVSRERLSKRDGHGAHKVVDRAYCEQVTLVKAAHLEEVNARDDKPLHLVGPGVRLWLHGEVVWVVLARLVGSGLWAASSEAEAQCRRGRSLGAGGLVVAGDGGRTGGVGGLACFIGGRLHFDKGVEGFFAGDEVRGASVVEGGPEHGCRGRGGVRKVGSSHGKMREGVRIRDARIRGGRRKRWGTVRVGWLFRNGDV